MDAKTVNYYSGWFTVVGWLAGVWFAPGASHVQTLWLVVFAGVGVIFAPAVIGGAIAATAAWFARKLTGHHEGSPDLLAWGAFISPVLAFFVARWTVGFLG